MLIPATVFALSFLGGVPAHPRAAPATSGATPSCIAPSRTGTFRLLAMNTKSNDPSTAILMLENIQGCLEATLVTEGNAPAVIERLVVAGDTLTGSLRLSTGVARVSFKFSEKDVVGSIVEGRREWTLQGQRTS